LRPPSYVSHAASESAPSGRYIAGLTLAALGVVYGDIGTSPLYALRECFYGEHAIEVTPRNVLGVLSMIVWSLLIIISWKYIGHVMKADNRGEGGILALTALVTPMRAGRGGRRWLIMLGLFGTALLYGDGMITPAVSVLSAVEGLSVATHFFDPYIVPIAVCILIALFVIQRSGTGRVGRIFGPVMMVWFVVLAVLGIVHIVGNPGVLAAVNPWYAAVFFAHNGWRGFLVLGSVFLVVTGGEALYADMGHFGKRPIKLAWFSMVLPGLVLNYFGQGALIIADARTAENPFFHMAPGWALYPLVVLSTFAAVIASQALISGAFSLTMQAVQLGYTPRVEIAHTSASERGQIYIPSINWMLMICCIGLVLGFRSSSNLAAAYGVAVTTTMVVTTTLFYVVLRHRWRWPRWKAMPLCGFFMAIDLSFFVANIVKIPHGGWFPLVVGAVVFTLMTTWKTGRRIVAERIREGTLPPELFLKSLRSDPPLRVPGTAIFMYGDPRGTPPALLHSLKHYKAIHKQVVFLSVITEETPHVEAADRVRVEEMGEGLYRVTVHYGFMQDPNLPHALALVKHAGLDLRPAHTTYFLGRETLIATRRPGMAIWREQLFAVMSRNARSATSFFSIPPNRVVELGTQIEI
jgi:KUP system potassium uptake protein